MPPFPSFSPHSPPTLPPPPPPRLFFRYDVMDVYVGVDALSADNTCNLDSSLSYDGSYMEVRALNTHHTTHHTTPHHTTPVRPLARASSRRATLTVSPRPSAHLPGFTFSPSFLLSVRHPRAHPAPSCLLYPRPDAPPTTAYLQTRPPPPSSPSPPRPMTHVKHGRTVGVPRRVVPAGVQQRHRQHRQLHALRQGS